MEIQPQFVQLELNFKGPLIKDMQVDNINDLITLNINYNYEHKLVWVKNDENYYYLINGNGSLLSHWKKLSQKLTIEQYQNKEYLSGEIVYLNNKIYLAKQDVPININPLDNLLYWEIIVGEIQTTRLMINNQNSLIIYTSIVNPYFEIFEGSFEFNNGTPIMDSDNLIKLNNAEKTEAQIIRRYDLINNNGKAYEIKFFENNLPYNLTGIINIK